MGPLTQFLADDLPQIRAIQSRMVAERRAQEERVRQEQARLADERRSKEEAVRQEQERRRQAAEEQVRRQTELKRIWENGSPTEVGASFGKGDDVIRHLRHTRGFSRREVVSGLHVGEHHVSRVNRQSSYGP